MGPKIQVLVALGENGNFCPVPKVPTFSRYKHPYITTIMDRVEVCVQV